MYMEKMLFVKHFGACLTLNIKTGVLVDYGTHGH